jgi:hypothetical protein
MRLATCITLACLLPLHLVALARAESRPAAVFPFELDDTSLQGEMRGRDEADQARLVRLDEQLLLMLSQSGQYRPVRVNADPAGPNLRSCDGCEITRAKGVDAQVAVIGWVQKVSNLILNINVVIRDVGSGQRIAAGSVDIRGDTNESWTRGLAYLLRNRILATQ